VTPLPTAPRPTPIVTAAPTPAATPARTPARLLDEPANRTPEPLATAEVAALVSDEDGNTEGEMTPIAETLAVAPTPLPTPEPTATATPVPTAAPTTPAPTPAPTDEPVVVAAAAEPTPVPEPTPEAAAAPGLVDGLLGRSSGPSRSLASVDRDQVRAVLFPELTQPGEPDPAAARERARLAARQGRWADAAREWARLVDADPASVEPRLEWAHALLRAGRTRRALEEYAAASALAPADGEIDLRWGNALASLGRTGEAEVRLLAARGKLPADPRVANNLGALYLMDDRPARALEVFRALTAEHPGFAPGFLNLALALEGTNAGPRAIEEALRAYLRLDGERVEEVRQWLRELGLE
jgi:tetratricopeptide (TPR) repeat protein